MSKLKETTTNGTKESKLNFTPPKTSLLPITKVLRTPDERFANLPDWTFQPRYVESRSHGELRIHYVDEGPKDAAETILLLHGEPTWSYLYRFMIPPLAAAGFRVVAIDLVGFGRSDKPAERQDYSYERQVNWMSDALVAIDVHQATLFAQDWGGLIGLRLVARFPERFLRISLGNTGLPIGGGNMTPTFKRWATEISQNVPDWTGIMQMSTERVLSQAELNAYEAPFVDESFRSGSRVLPHLVPMFDAHDSVEENKGAIKRVFTQWNRPFITFFSDKDPVTRGGEKFWHKLCPGCVGQAHCTILGAGHFLQEDASPELVEVLLEFISDNPVKLPIAASRL